MAILSWTVWPFLNIESVCNLEKGQVSKISKYNDKRVKIFIYVRLMNKSKSGRRQGALGKKAKSSIIKRQQWQQENANQQKKARRTQQNLVKVNSHFIQL